MVIYYPVHRIVKRKYIKEYGDVESISQSHNRNRIRRAVIIEFSAIIGAEALIVIAFFLPWFAQSNAVYWSLSYIFQQVFTWYNVLSYSGAIVPLGFLALYIGAGIYALYKPLYGGLMNLFMPIFVSFYIGSATFGHRFLFTAHCRYRSNYFRNLEKANPKEASGRIKSLIVKRKIIFSEENSNCLSLEERTISDQKS